MKLIVHAGTGTIIDADDGVFVIDTDLVQNEALGDFLDDDDETAIVEIAQEKGRRLNSAELEMTHANSIAFTPSALRYEATELDVDSRLAEWVSTTSASNLEYVASLIMNDDLLWQNYKQIIVEALRSAYEKDTAR